jgi:hypothetical protein
MQSQEVNRFEACEKLYSMCSDGLAREVTFFEPPFITTRLRTQEHHASYIHHN